MHELDFLRMLRSASPGPRGAVRLGIGDDAAVLRPRKGQEVIVTTDFSLETIHFRRDWHPGRAAGHRCLSRGLSDLAAMGAQPLAAFLSLALPRGTFSTVAGSRYVEDFLVGLLTLAAKTRCPLAGGDTATAPGSQILADIVLVGSVPQGRALMRRGAQPGDGIYVTGRLGGAAAELEQLAARPKKFARATAEEAHPHLFPQPRLAVGQALLRRKLATACMDLSDGLAMDLPRLCEESGVGALIEETALPLAGTLQQALGGGEDYELLFTSPQKLPGRLAAVEITRIGTITPRRSGIRMRTAAGKTAPLPRTGWEHSL